MSQTQYINTETQSGITRLNSEFSGIRRTPEALSETDRETALYLVERGELRGSSSLDELSEVFLELGLGTKGFLGVHLCPLTKEAGYLSRVQVYKKTIPVWVVDAGSAKGYQGKRYQTRYYFTTKQFVVWLRSNLIQQPPKQGGLGSFNRSTFTLPLLPEVGELPPSLPHAPRAAPLPSAAAPRQAPLPSYVSDPGDVNRDNSDPLRQAEEEFRAVPRIRNEAGQESYDNDEYFRRLDSLNPLRSRRGLAQQQAPTPSTYSR
jgi:hypothetical protein